MDQKFSVSMCVYITDDFGDYLLKAGRVDQEEYERKQAEAKQLLGV